MSFFNKLVIRSALFSALLLLIQPTQSTALGRTYTDRGRNRAQFEGNRSQRCAPLAQRVQILPSANEAIQVGRDNYHYSKTNFYRRNNQGAFVVITALLCSRVCQLPTNRIRLLIGSPRYFYANYTYYLWDSNRPDYQVVEEPEGAETEVVAASETTGELCIYAAEGQPDEERGRDRYDCYLWASDQTDFDPSQTNQNSELASDCRQAISVCLEGCGYTVK